MTTTTRRPVRTETLDVPGAVLTYDVHGDLATATQDAPALMLVGTPMTAEPFWPVADHFEDRPVITYDPRNTGRSRCTTDATPTPEDHAADIHAIIRALRPQLGSPRVDVFGSSGGAAAVPYACWVGSCARWPSGSSWNVQCATSKCSPRQLPRVSRISPERPRARWSCATTTWAESTGRPLVMVQTCRSWTSTTPGVSVM